MKQEEELESGRTLEEVFEQLDEIVEKLQSQDVSLDETVKLYTEGMGLLKESDAILRDAEKKVLQIDEEGRVDEF
ncbi:MAG: exodeoxyribonuclease VII small subunit [Lachnospiraceae bacterium]